MAADTPKGGQAGKKTTRSTSKAAAGGSGAKKKAPAKKTAASRKSSAKKSPAKKGTTRKRATAKSASKKKAESAEPIEEQEVAQELESQPVASEAAGEQHEEPMTEATPEPTQNADTAGDAVELADEVSAASAEASGDAMMANRMIAFHLGGQRYGVPIEVVQEIQQIVAFSEIPAAGGAVVGMVNLRGAVIPAIDMRFLIGLAPEEYTLETPMVICRAHGQLVALIVDEVEDVLTMPEGCMQDPPAMHSLSSKMLGVCRLETDLVYLLDVESLVAPVELPRG